MRQAVKIDSVVFPAYAGVIPVLDFFYLFTKGLSRIRGGDPSVSWFVSVTVLSFPHTRG